jgi:dGTPase
VGEALAAARLSGLDVPSPRLRYETIRRVINALITDLIEETQRRLAQLQPQNADAVRRARERVVAFSPAMAGSHLLIREFLFARMYRHWRVNRMAMKARRLTGEVFRVLHDDPSLLPDDWRTQAGEGGTQRAASVVGDYVAGMTDRYAMDEYRRLTDIGVSG